MLIAVLYLLLAWTGAGWFGLLRQRRIRRLTAAWDSGHTARARCVSARPVEVQDADGAAVTVVHHLLEFTAADGRVISYEERDAPDSLARGDLVTVHYDPGAPEQATVLADSFWRRYQAVVLSGVMATTALATAVVLALVLG